MQRDVYARIQVEMYAATRTSQMNARDCCETRLSTCKQRRKRLPLKRNPLAGLRPGSEGLSLPL